MEKSDFETVAHWFQDLEDLSLFDRTLRMPLNQLQTEEIWSDAVSGFQNCGKCWFVIEDDAGQSVGVSGLEAISSINRDAVIPLFVDKSVRRSGVGIRAGALTLDFAFRQLGLHRITSYYRDDNLSTRDLVNRLGFKVEGTMRQAWFTDGRYHDMVVVGILQQEWMARRADLARDLSPDTCVTFGGAASDKWCWPLRGAAFE